MAAEYEDVMALSGLKDRELAKITYQGKEVCVIRVGNEIYAFSNICTHIGGRLSEGRLGKDGHIVCPEHRAVFDMKSGGSLSFPRRGLVTYDVKIENSRVFLKRQANPEVWRKKFPSIEDAKFS
jgi:nitrite reductase/ring-hydroxylating ferredoxin subunit